MAIFCTLNDTDKAGWVRVQTNMLYPANTKFKDFFVRKSSLVAVEFLQSDNGVEHLEVYRSDRHLPYTISHDLGQSMYYPVESINGVAVSSLLDLRDKLLAIL